MRFSHGSSVVMFILAGVTCSGIISAQQKVTLPQQWEGTVQAPNKKIGVLVSIVGTVRGLTAASIARIDEKRGEVPVFPCLWQMPDAETVRVIDTTGNVRFEGKLADNRRTIIGSWADGPTTLPLTLKSSAGANSKTFDNATATESPAVETISFQSATGATYDAKLYRPRGVKHPPGAVFIPGGDVIEPTDPLSQMLIEFSVGQFARHGLALLWIQYKGQGKLDVPLKMSATDLAAAMALLRKRTDIDAQRVGLIGYGTGGIATLLAADSGAEPNFLVLLATPLVPAEQAQAQTAYGMNRRSGASPQSSEQSKAITLGLFDLVKRGASEHEKEQWISEKAAGNAESRQKLVSAMHSLARPRLLDYLHLDVAQILSRVACPTLAVYGSDDLMTPPEPNTAILRQVALKANGVSIQSRELPGLDHGLRAMRAGLLPDYSFDDVVYDTTVNLAAGKSQRPEDEWKGVKKQIK